MTRPNPFDLSGKVALVTGGSSGLGRAFCEAMAESGSDVAFSYLTGETGAKETETMVAEYGVKALAIKADVSKPADVQAMFDQVDREFGKLDILFNNAGLDLKPRRIHETPLEEWNWIIAVNLTGVFLCMQEGIKLMLRQRKGSIINISSIFGLGASGPFMLDPVGYVVTKWGVIGLTKQVASEYGADGIRVNAIAPGFFAPTNITRHMGRSAEGDKLAMEETKKLTPLHRWGDPAELKGIAIYLASDASSFTTGAVFPVDGGWSSW